MIENQLSKYYAAEKWRDTMHVKIRLQTCPFARIERIVPKEGRILDFGCGHGVLSLWLHITGSARTVVGYDCDEHKIACAQRVTRDVSKLQFVCDDSYCEEPLYDTIIVSDVLCFVKEKEQLLHKLLGLLKPGGVFIVKDIARNSGLGFWWTYMQDFLAKNVLRITAAHGLYYIRSEAMETLFKNLGFNDIELTDLSAGYAYPHFLVRGKK